MLTAYFLHRVLALLFLLLIPLPFVSLVKRRKKTELGSAVIWLNIIRITNLGLVVVLISGITLYPFFSSIRTWVAIVLTLAIGGLLGVLSKQLKQYILTGDQSSRLNLLQRISILGFSYIGVIVIIFGFMSHWYQF
ncbi:hypothetical protein H1D32_16985 [Anaerobacillus sp. CMMVII]|uniref:hypothetical protein n=1 Tax=Anaerobacillus sp. CMMVII TaxID=2755588 RepID=UPI0021B71261|nr:hypothetical protein [Anaerobacillus sp. CMMVII]MCT8139249.1 hypothetical protein [Anaerobacillus sp. CMMVII]